jgi:sulfur carrier protein
VIVEVNGEATELADGATVAEVVERVRPGHTGRGVAVAIDAEVVPRAEWGRRRVGDGDRIEVLTAVQGG